MPDLEKVIKGLECCSDMDGNKCSKCPYAKECEEAPPGAVFVGSAHLCADALELLKAQEQRKRLEVHNIGNVDIPEGVTEEQFHAVMNNVVKTLEHTDRGESWPYEEEEGETP